MNKERAETLEKALTRRLRKRRIMLGIVVIVSVIMSIAFSMLWEGSKKVVKKLVAYYAIHETIVYNNDYGKGVCISMIVAIISGSYLFVDLFVRRVQTVEANGHYITVYKGSIKRIVYVNGEEQGSFGKYSHTDVIDTKLPDGTKVTVAFSRYAYKLAHISFSDDNPPIDL